MYGVLLTVYNVRRILYDIFLTAYNVRRTLYGILLTAYNVRRTLYGEQCTRIRSHMILCSLIHERITPYDVRTAYALHSTTYILRHISYNINCRAYVLPTTMYPDIYILRRITQRVQFATYTVPRTVYDVHSTAYNFRRA